MVSGLVTSPWDQLRMTSGDARRMRMELNTARRRGSRSSVRLNPSFPAVMPRGDWSSVSRLIPQPPSICGRRPSDFFKLHLETETLKLLDQDVEGLRHPGLRRVLALDDRLA